MATEQKNPPDKPAPEMKLWRRGPNKFGVVGLESLDDLLEKSQKGEEASPISFDKPILFCLGGVNVVPIIEIVDNVAKHNNINISGFAKIAESLMGGEDIYKQGVQLIPASYEPMPEWEKLKALLNSKRHTRKGLEARDRSFSKLANHYANSMIQKVFAREGVIPDITGLHDDSTARDSAVAECARKMSHVNFMGYSLGTTVVPVIHDKLCALMDKRGFTETEIEKTLRQVHVVNFGETGLWYNQALRSWNNHKEGHKPWYFTSVHFVSTNDRQAGSLSDIDSALLTKNGKRDVILRFGKKNNENVLLFLSQIPSEQDFLKLGTDKDGKVILRPIYTAASKAREKFEETADDKKISGIRRKVKKWRLETKIKTSELSLGEGHNPKLYTGEADIQKDPYFSEVSGGWRFLPSALKSALRNAVLKPRENGNCDLAALLQTAELLESEKAILEKRIAESNEKDKSDHKEIGKTEGDENGKVNGKKNGRTSRRTKDKGNDKEENNIYWPALEGYGYSKRIQNLLDDSIHLPELPSRNPHSWRNLITEQLSARSRDASTISIDPANSTHMTHAVRRGGTSPAELPGH